MYSLAQVGLRTSVTTLDNWTQSGDFIVVCVCEMFLFFSPAFLVEQPPGSFILRSTGGGNKQSTE